MINYYTVLYIGQTLGRTTTTTVRGPGCLRGPDPAALLLTPILGHLHDYAGLKDWARQLVGVPRGRVLAVKMWG